MALALFKQFEGRNGGSFNASSGWPQNFKKRFKVRLLKIAGQKLSAQSEIVQPFKEALSKIIIELGVTRDQIYNADETGLFYKCLPERTYVSANERNAPGRKSAKERVTFLACTNATGFHKLNPLIIGKAKIPGHLKM